MPCCAPGAASPMPSPDWALSAAGLDGLRGRGGQGDREEEGWATKTATGSKNGTRTPARMQPMRACRDGEEAPFEGRRDRSSARRRLSPRSMPRTPGRSGRSPARAAPARERDPLVYDPDWDEDARLVDWRAVVDQTRGLPPALAAAIATEAWDRIEPLQHTPWLGRLLAAALLRGRGKTRHTCRACMPG